jgi:hypothetical protein
VLDLHREAGGAGLRVTSRMLEAVVHAAEQLRQWDDADQARALVALAGVAATPAGASAPGGRRCANWPLVEGLRSCALVPEVMFGGVFLSLFKAVQAVKPVITTLTACIRAWRARRPGASCRRRARSRPRRRSPRPPGGSCTRSPRRRARPRQRHLRPPCISRAARQTGCLLRACSRAECNRGAVGRGEQRVATAGCVAQVAAPLVASAHAAINSGRAARRWISRGPNGGGYYAGAASDGEGGDAGSEEGEETELEW